MASRAQPSASEPSSQALERRPTRRAISTHTVHSSATPSPRLDLILLAILALTASRGGYCTWSALVLLALFVKSRTSSVLNESILAIAGLGLQLSTTRGLVLSFPTLSTPLKIPLSTSRLFLPLASISDVVINEGIYGWTIIYYLVIIQDEGQGPVKLRVGYPELLPRLDELREVWKGVRCTLYDELLEEEETNVPLA